MDGRKVQTFVFALFVASVATAQIQTQQHLIDAAFPMGFWMQAVDFDLDGDADLVAGSQSDGLFWYQNNGQGGFTRKTISTDFPLLWSFHVADLDGDGDLDVAACSQDSSKISWFEQTAGGSFVEHLVDDDASLQPHSVYIVDLDGDNDADILAGAWTANQILWYENDGAQAFTRRVVDASFSSPHSVAAADLDNDGDRDVLAAGGGQTAWFRNDGNGAFVKKKLSGGGFAIVPVDLDGDGLTDLLRTERSVGDVDWFRNTGAGSFSKTTLAAALGTQWSIAAGDLDLDGDADLVTARFNDNLVTILVGDNAGYTQQTLLDGATRPRVVALADFDRDGDLDIAVMVTDDGRIFWFEVLAATPPEPTLTLTKPNGGEALLGGATFTVEWQFTGILPGVSLEYSVDAGQTWLPIVTNTPNNGFFDWAVPDVNTDTALLRISDGADGVPADTSDGVFSIEGQMLTLISPNGGESWLGGTSQTISWSSSGFIENVRLEYSLDAGATWNEIVASTPDTGSFRWNVPDVNSEAVLVRISDAADGMPADQSDGSFTIIGQGLTLTRPNGGENWLMGSTQTIAWTSTGAIDRVRLEFSPDGGATWNEIAADAPNSGSFAWTLPNTLTTDARVRISDAADGTPADESDAAFAIVDAVLTVTAPNGGEEWFAGKLHTITWTSMGTIAAVRLEYSTDGGNSWTEIAGAAANTGSFLWTVPDIYTTDALVRISDAGDGIPFDVSDAVFSIVKEQLTIVSPNGGETLSSGMVAPIVWTSSGPIGNVRLEYSINNGGSWAVITISAPNTGSFDWQVPDVLTFNALVRISDAADGNPTDVSDAVFTIEPEGLTLTAPNGGESWSALSVHNITWTSTGAISEVKLEYSTDSGGSWNLIAANAPNTGSFAWTVPEVESDNALVRISDAGDGSPVDVSDAAFQMVIDAITITSPNGGERWITGSNHAITWDSKGAIATVFLEYSADGGTTWHGFFTGAPNTGSFNWTVPNTLTDQALIRISDAADGAPSDVSDRPFSIVSSNLTLLAPNGGESWFAGDTETILWTSEGEVDFVDLAYSADDGRSWTPIATQAQNSGSYEWVVPALQTNQARVRVSDTATPSTFDVSDEAFHISTARLTLTSPNGGEIWQVGTDQTITWSTDGAVAAVKIEYSVDNAKTWKEIVPRTFNFGTFSWTVPPEESDSARVRISDADTGIPADVSDSVFTITATISGIRPAQRGDVVPDRFALMQNYPNPFNLGTRIDFAVAQGGEAQLTLYNLRGNVIRRLYRGHLSPGVYSVAWDGRDDHGQVVTTGIYIYRLRVGKWSAARRLLLLK